WFHVTSPFGPKKSARMLLSMPSTVAPIASKNVTASEPMRPALPVTRTLRGMEPECTGGPQPPCQTRAVRVAVALEQCWHSVPGGTARAAIDQIAAIDATGEVELVGVSARHR